MDSGGLSGMRLDIDKLFRNKKNMSDNVLTKERRDELVEDLMELSKCLYLDGADDGRSGNGVEKNIEDYGPRLEYLINKIIDKALGKPIAVTPISE